METCFKRLSKKMNCKTMNVIDILDGKESLIYAKREFLNPSGSVKDRIARYIMDRAQERGELKPGQPIVEVTSGNTGIAFSAV